MKFLLWLSILGSVIPTQVSKHMVTFDKNLIVKLNIKNFS